MAPSPSRNVSSSALTALGGKRQWRGRHRREYTSHPPDIPFSALSLMLTVPTDDRTCARRAASRPWSSGALLAVPFATTRRRRFFSLEKQDADVFVQIAVST